MDYQSLASFFNYGFFSKYAEMSALPHQNRVKDKLVEERKGLLVYHGLGSGKTFTAINAAKELDMPMLAIVPASLRENFKKEIEKSNFKGDYRVVSYEEATKKKENLDFLNYAANALVVYDEAHRMGRSESERSRLPSEIPAKKVLMLTGTPVRNSPEEIIPLMRALDVKMFPRDPASFKDRYIMKREIRPGLWAKWRHGVKPGTEDVPKNLKDFQKKTVTVVDHHDSFDKDNYPAVTEKIVEVPMSDKQIATYSAMLGLMPQLAYKMTHGIPPDKAEMTNMQAFLTGPRMVSNTPVPYSNIATAEDAVKVQALVGDLADRFHNDKNFRGLVYSNYLEHGVNEIAGALDEKKIPYIKFTGEMNDKKKREAVNSYNNGKVPVLLISSSGGEGLDLKGTKLVQILEPHWNEEKLNQVKGRAIRYKSHSHLPKEEQKVEVINYHATVPKSTLQSMLGWRPDFSSDQYLYNLSRKKSMLNEHFLSAMRGEEIKDRPKEESGIVYGINRYLFGDKVDYTDPDVKIEQYKEKKEEKTASEFSSMAPLIDDAVLIGAKMMSDHKNEKINLDEVLYPENTQEDVWMSDKQKAALGLMGAGVTAPAFRLRPDEELIENSSHIDDVLKQLLDSEGKSYNEMRINSLIYGTARDEKERIGKELQRQARLHMLAKAVPIASLMYGGKKLYDAYSAPELPKEAEGIDDFQQANVDMKDAPTLKPGTNTAKDDKKQQIGSLPPEKVAALKKALIKLAPKIKALKSKIAAESDAADKNNQIVETIKTPFHRSPLGADTETLGRMHLRTNRLVTGAN